MKSTPERPFVLRLLASVLGLVFVGATVPGVAMVRQQSFGEIVRAADLVFSGVVVEQRCRYGAGEQMIFTDVTFSVEEVYLHRAGSRPLDQPTLVLSFAGGTIGEQHIRVSDVPSFDTGERYLVCTKWDNIQHASPVIGFFQGRFVVITDEATGARYPLTADRRPIVGLRSGQLAYGPRATSINDGKVRRAGEIVPDRRFEVPPRPAGESAERGAWATPGLDHTVDASQPFTLSELAAEIHRLAAVAATEGR